METQENDQQQITNTETTKKERNYLPVIIILAIVAVLGVGFGVYGVLESNRKNDEIVKLQVENDELNAIEEERALEDLETVVNDEGETEVEMKNPVIMSTDSKSYTIIGGSSDYSISGESEPRKLSIYLVDGKVVHCDIYKQTSQTSYQGERTCEITGLSDKRIYKVIEFGAGHVNVDNMIGFIMEDGTVEYLSLKEAIVNSNYNILGTLKIDGFVVDSVSVSTNNESGMGGYGTTMFILKDGNYIEYSNSMLE